MVRGELDSGGVAGAGTDVTCGVSLIRRALTGTVLVAILAAGCGRSGDSATTNPSDGGSQGSTASTTAAQGVGAGEFGDLGAVCGPAPAGTTLKATDVGVTADSIQLGTVSDPGFSGRPGLNQEIFDSGEAFTKWCNDAGGIYGRKIDMKQRDAKLTEYQPRMIEACDEHDFMLVGGGGVFDDQGQKERLGCGLPNIAAFVTNPPAVASDLSMTSIPNDLDTVPIGDLLWLQKKFPEATKKIGILTAGVAVTMTAAQRVKEAMAALGWKIVYDEKYNAAGEASWRGYAEGLKASGARGVVWVADPGNLAALLKSMAEIEYTPDFVRAGGNIYDPILLSEGGQAADNVYIGGSHYPFLDPAMAKQNPATQQYLDIMGKFVPGGKIANLGVSGFSAWLLFAKAALACGADLTRDCVWKNASDVSEWTGGGLHARQDLASGGSAECYVEMLAHGGEFSLPDIGANEGVFNCDPKNVMKLTGDYGMGVKCENPAFSTDPKPSNCAP